MDAASHPEFSSLARQRWHASLKRGGPDAPSNMGWQTRDTARQKDRTE